MLRWRDLAAPSEAARGEYAVAAAAVVKQGSLSATLDGFRETLRRDPNSPAALNNLACLLATAPDAALRNGREAVQLAEKACALTDSRNTVMLATLAAAYAEAGRFPEAIATAEKACALAAEKGEQQLLERNRQLLEFYRRNQPYHQPAP